MDPNLSISAFVLTCLIIELTPGPNMGFLALVAATKGRRLGFFTVMGIALGLLVVGLLAAVGVAAIIERSAVLYELLRWGGGAYLLVLAFQQWRDASRDTRDPEPNASRTFEYFRYGLVVNLLNPKAAVFYIAILPTYLRVGDNLDGSATFGAMGLTVIYVGIATAIHLLIVIFAGALQPVLQKEKLRRNTTRILAVLLACVAVWMVFTTAR